MLFKSSFFQESGSTPTWRSCMRWPQGGILHNKTGSSPESRKKRVVGWGTWLLHKMISWAPNQIFLSSLVWTNKDWVAVIILQYCQFGNIEFRNITSLEILQYQNIVSQAILKYQNIASLEFSQYCESGNMLPLLVVLSLHCKSDRDLHLGMRCSPEYYLLKKWEFGILPSKKNGSLGYYLLLDILVHQHCHFWEILWNNAAIHIYHK